MQCLKEDRKHHRIGKEADGSLVPWTIYIQNLYGQSMYIWFQSLKYQYKYFFDKKKSHKCPTISKHDEFMLKSVVKGHVD